MAPGERDTLLIVDDDPINRAILEGIFSPHYAILEAADGRSGVRKILERGRNGCVPSCWMW